MAQGWLDAVQYSEDAPRGGGAVTRGGRRRQVVVRSYLPGHDGCHYHHEPWRTYEQADMKLPYNWAEIKLFNQEFQACVALLSSAMHRS